MIIIGYSGHSFVACGILIACGKSVTAYCDFEEKNNNPYNLTFLGSENSEEGHEAIMNSEFFIGVGDNMIRQKVYDRLSGFEKFPVNAIHPSAIISENAFLSKNGIMISAGAVINPLAKIGHAAICNTGCIVEHECVVESFAHIGPGAVLCGNVHVGTGSFVGAAAVIRQGVRIGAFATIGAGAVVLKDVADNEVVVGNPSKCIKP
ncbi:MAG: acetyltransferase [Chitinophagaceae bacterium]|nr:MAG: acetyltransferase [Chitinophagaceae bacterium]